MQFDPLFSSKARGEWERRIGRLKLTDEQVREVRKIASADCAAYAKRVGVNVTTIRKARKRKSYTWVPDQEE